MIRAVSIFGLLLLACLATSALVGGYQDVDVDDDGVLTAADHAARALSATFAGKFHHRLAKIVKAERQVVAGVNYRLDIIVGKTTCEKSGEYDTECEFQDNLSTYKKCTVVVYRDLHNTHKLTSSGCILASRDEVY